MISTESPSSSFWVSVQSSPMRSIGQLALVAAGRVDAVLELVHRDLAEDGGDLALDRLGEQAEARAGSSASAEQPSEDDLLGEDRGRLGDRQRRVLVEDALLAGERLVQAVAELVGEGEHVAAAVRVVEEHVGVDRGDGRGAEGAAALDRGRRSVDPALLEEALNDLRGVAREGGERVGDQLAALLPGDLLVVVGDRGHAVVVGEALDAEQPRLGLVPAPGQVVAALDRLDQGLHRLVGGLVGEVARGEPVRVGAQAVLDRLVLEERVEDVGAGAQAGLERLGHRLGRRLALLAVGVEQAARGRRRATPARPRPELDPDRRGELVEEAAPGRAAGDRELGRDRLLGLAEQVRPVAALHAQVVAAEVEALGGEQLLGAVVGDLDPLELEEEELRLDRRAALADHLHQGAVGRILGVGREAQVREVGGAPGQLGDLGEPLHRRAQALGRRARRPCPRARRRTPPPAPRPRSSSASTVASSASAASASSPSQQVGEVPGDVLERGGFAVTEAILRTGCAAGPRRCSACRCSRSASTRLHPPLCRRRARAEAADRRCRRGPRRRSASRTGPGGRRGRNPCG